MRFAAFSLVLLAGCAVPTEGEEYAKLFGDLVNDGLGGAAPDAGPPCVPACEPAHPFCVAGACMDCATSADCAVGEACSPLYKCETACASGADCPLSHMCNESHACEIVDGGG